MRSTDASEPTIIANYAGPRAFAPRTRAALRGLGYELVPAIAQGRFDDDSWKPALRIVDERHLEKIPSAKVDPSIPVILLAGLRPKHCKDPRIVGTVQRPAELVPLFQLIQEALESHPRKTPRVSTQLSARCIRSDRRTVGAVLSLSERGCLFQSSERVDAGDRMNLQFALPNVGVISTRAECVHHTQGALGLAFADPCANTRHSIGDFVAQRLATM